MIRINLLPVEHRKKARTPLKLVFALAGVVTVNSGLVTWWAWQRMGVQAEIESEAALLQTDMDGLTPQVNYHRSLESEAKQYKTREDTLASITTSRVSWTKKLDELIDVVNRGQNGQRHLVWLDDLQVSQSMDPKAKIPGSVRANGHSGSDKFAQVANFLEDLEMSQFIGDFQPPAPPEGTQTNVDETLMPPVAWSFPLSLTLKSTDERLGKDKKGAKDGKDAKKDPKGAKADPKDAKDAKDAAGEKQASADPKAAPAKDAGAKTEAKQ
jgi:Tfp pilus assembly protein PilN